jgi:parvulin-like peptidyl-prolyl isomerase
MINALLIAPRCSRENTDEYLRDCPEGLYLGLASVAYDRRAHIGLRRPRYRACEFLTPPEARAIANAVLTELKQTPYRFGELAKLHSACPSAAQGGHLGQISAGQTTPEFEQALLALTPGAMTREPVETRYGLHVIRLDRKIEGQELPFELVAERIADYLRESVVRRASAQYVARLVSRADITGITLAGAEAHRVN